MSEGQREGGREVGREGKGGREGDNVPTSLCCCNASIVSATCPHSMHMCFSLCDASS